MKKFTIQSPVDALELSCLLTEPAAGTKPKGVFQLVHGMCEHKERYVPFMEFLRENAFVCIVHDHRGHGESVLCEEDLGYFGKGGWEALIEDTKAVSDYVKSRYPGLKLHLLGHSMGSMVARSYVKRHDDNIDSLFLTGCPSDNLLKGVGKFLAGVLGRLFGWHHRSELLQKMSFGAYNKPFSHEKYSRAWVCSNEDTLESYHNDPLCQYVFTTNGFYNLTSLMQDCYSPEGWTLKKPELPVHFMSGALDPCRGNDAALKNAVELMKSVGYGNTDLITFKGMRHEILNETDKLTVWNHVIHTVA